MSLMNEVPQHRFTKVWDYIDKALDRFSRLHKELELKQDEPESVKRIVVEIQKVQHQLDNDLY